MNCVLTIDGGAFQGLKADFDEMLQGVLRTMLQKDGEVADIRIALKIQLKKQVEENDRGRACESIFPTFEHKITAQMTYKAEKGGNIGGPMYKLDYDPSRNAYVIRDAGGEQLGFFDYAEGAE